MSLSLDMLVTRKSPFQLTVLFVPFLSGFTVANDFLHHANNYDRIFYSFKTTSNNFRSNSKHIWLHLAPLVLVEGCYPRHLALRI